MLVYEAVRDAPTETFDVKTPVAVTTGVRLQQPPLLVPVLRAGLGMVEQAHALIPQAQVGFVGLARDEKTFEPVPYLESLPEDLSGLPVFVLDPMLATGGSMVHTLDILAQRGATDITAICVVAAPQASRPLLPRVIRSGWSRRRSMKVSTRTSTSCRVSAMRGTGSSGRDKPHVVCYSCD